MRSSTGGDALAASTPAVAVMANPQDYNYVLRKY
jgi:hypothetical protein